MDSNDKPGKPVELIFDEMHGRTSGVKITDAWIDEVEKRTNGRVHFTHYYGEDPSITEIADVIRDVPAIGGQYHLLDLIQQPFIFPSSVVASKVISQLYAEFPEVREEMSDVKILGLGTGSLMAIFSSKAWGPIHTMEDLKGARMRSLLPIDKVVEALGAKPLHVEFMEIASLLEKGELDATVIGVIPAMQFKLAEHGTPYCTVVGGKSVTMHPIRFYMAWDKWNNLPPDIQKVIEELGPAGGDCWFADHMGSISDNFLAYAQECIKESGGETIIPPPEELERWVKVIQPLREAAINVSESKGLPGKKFFDRVLELAEEYSA